MERHAFPVENLARDLRNSRHPGVKRRPGSEQESEVHRLRRYGRMPTDISERYEAATRTAVRPTAGKCGLSITRLTRLGEGEQSDPRYVASVERTPQSLTARRLRYLAGDLARVRRSAASLCA